MINHDKPSFIASALVTPGTKVAYHFNEFINQFQLLPSGKRLPNYGKSQFLIGKSTISMAMFNSFCMFTGG